MRSKSKKIRKLQTPKRYNTGKSEQIATRLKTITTFGGQIEQITFGRRWQ